MSEWQTVLVCAMVALVGIFAYVLYLNIKLSGAEKK
jgi:hypothetical protein